METERKKAAITQLGQRHHQREVLRESQAPEPVTNLNYSVCNHAKFKRGKSVWTVTSKAVSPMKTEELRSWSFL